MLQDQAGKRLTLGDRVLSSRRIRLTPATQSTSGKEKWSHLRQGLGIFTGAEHNVPALLLQDGFPMTNAPHFIYRELAIAAKHSSHSVIKTTSPEEVATFYKQLWDDDPHIQAESRLTCALADAPCQTLKSPWGRVLRSIGCS